MAWKGALSMKKIEAFTRILLRTSGMRFTEEQEILMVGEEAQVSLYGIRYSKDGDERVLEERVLCSPERVLELLDRCGVLKWDGFWGAHPKGVRDGIMFSLKAEVNGGQVISAEGSENFPRHYREFTDGLREILRESGPEQA
jgi:hypothetical protein